MIADSQEHQSELFARELPVRTAAGDIAHVLMRHSIELVNILAPDGSIRWISPSLKPLLGYEQAELIGRRPIEFVHPDDAPTMIDTFQKIQANPFLSVAMCVRLKHKDGSWRWMEGCGQNLLGDPVVQGITTNSHDVTERVTMLAKLKEAQRMEAVGRLAGGIAHEFNNLLTVISYYSETMLERCDDKERFELEEVKKASDRAVIITRQLLAFSRQQVLQPTVIKPNLMINQALPLLRKSLREDLALVVSLDARVSSVKVDPAQFTDVLVTLVTNAANAISGSGTITIRTSSASVSEPAMNLEGLSPGHYTTLSVEDTGPRVKKEIIARMFEPFFATPGRGPGTGIGLSAAYGIVKQSGGHIIVTSPKMGASFTIYLPTVTEGPVERRIPAKYDSEAEPLILVVEDEAGVRQVMKNILEKAGYRVADAEHGKAALAYLESVGGKVDFLLTDTVMPELGGQALVRQVHKRWPDIPIAFMSGHSDEAVRKGGKLAPGTKFLRKPFAPSDLIDCIRESLRSNSSPGN